MNHYQEQARRISEAWELLTKAGIIIQKSINMEARVDCPDDTDYVALLNKIRTAMNAADKLYDAIDALVME